MWGLPLSVAMGGVGWAVGQASRPKRLFPAEPKRTFACSGLAVEATEAVVFFCPMGICYVRVFLRYRAA